MQSPNPEQGATSDVTRKISSDPQAQVGFKHYANIIRLCTSSTCEQSRAELSAEMASSELAGELPEFYALIFRAILDMIEGSKFEFVIYYLEMAKTVATSAEELAVAHETWSTYESLQTDLPRAAERCLAGLGRLYQISDRAAC